MRIDVILEEEEDGMFSVHCPALKGCHSQGKTRDEAMKNIQEAIDLYLEVSREMAEKTAKGQPKSILVEIAV